MQTIILDAEAGQLSAELARRGIGGSTKVHAVVEVALADDLPGAALAQSGGGFDWLDDEPELYTDADLQHR